MKMRELIELPKKMDNMPSTGEINSKRLRELLRLSKKLKTRSKGSLKKLRLSITKLRDSMEPLPIDIRKLSNLESSNSRWRRNKGSFQSFTID